MGRTKSIETERKWRAHLAAWETSGLSLRAFALREGIKIGSLGNWRRRLKSTPRARTSFVPVVVSDDTPRAAAPFELVVRGGMSLRIPSDFDEATLTRIVRALGDSR